MVLLSYLIPAAGLLALLFALWRAMWVKKQKPGNARMQEIAGFIRTGAMAFLARQYRVLAVFVLVVGVGLGVANYFSGDASWLVSVAFVGGALCSALAGYFGMQVATLANVRAAHAAETGLNKALGVAFNGGAVMGMCVVGLAVLGLGLFFLLFKSMFGMSVGDPKWGIAAVISAISGFSLGASSIALFARVGGGIYTKAADVGADLVGKIKYGFDDMRDVLERASARETAMRVALGAAARKFLSECGVCVASRVVAVGGEADGSALSVPVSGLNALADSDPVRCADARASRRMAARIAAFSCSVSSSRSCRRSWKYPASWGKRLWKMRKNLISGIKRGVADVKKSAAASEATERTEKDLSFKVVLMGIAAVFVLMVALYYYFTGVLGGALLAAVLLLIAGCGGGMHEAPPALSAALASSHVGLDTNDVCAPGYKVSLHSKSP